MKTSRATRALVACAVFVAGAVAVVGPSPASAAGPKLDNGIGTQAALANPNCDPQTKQIKILLIARGPLREARAPPSKNGGSTAPGVTKDSVKVVIVVEEDPTKPPTTPGGIGIAGKNQATGGAGTLADDAKYESEMLAHFYETYGRKLDIEFYVRTGLDEIAQRADALAIAEKKPFAVLSALPTTGDVLAQKKIITFDVPSDPKVIELQAPYRWSWSTDYFVDDTAGRRGAGQAALGRQGEVGGRRVDAQQDPQVRDHLPGQRRRLAVPRPRGVRDRR